MKTKIKTKLRVGDEVIVVSGKEKGKRGKILSFRHEKQSALVEGVNVVKKGVKKSQENQKGGFQEKELAIHISNIMYFDKSSKKGVRVGWSFGENGKKERIFKTPKK